MAVDVSQNCASTVDLDIQVDRERSELGDIQPVRLRTPEGVIRFSSRSTLVWQTALDATDDPQEIPYRTCQKMGIIDCDAWKSLRQRAVQG